MSLLSMHGAMMADGIADPFWTSVGYLMHCEGTNGGTTFTDSGPNGFTISRSGTSSGGIITSTGWSQFGATSIYCPSAVGNEILLPADAACRGAGSNWTWEASLYRSSSGVNQVLMDGNNDNSNTTGPAIYIDTAGKLNVYQGANSTNYGGGGTSIPTSSLRRVRVVWDGTNLLFYIEGTLDQTVTGFVNTWPTSHGPNLFSDKTSFPAQGYLGYCDEIRFTRAARSTGSSYALEGGPFPHG